MNRLFPCLLLLAAFCIGCNSEPEAEAPAAADVEPEIAHRDIEPPFDGPAPPLTGEATVAEREIAAADDPSATSTIPLSPNNMKIQFVGTHTGDDPKPRTGTFEKFTGYAIVDGDQLQELSVDIETASLKTEIDKLTNHLKSADFFDVRQFPTATFQSTNIEMQEDGTAEITGDLTLVGKTESITFPAKVSTDGALELEAEFTLDRTQFGMNYGPEQVEKDVTMTVSIGNDS